MNPSRDQQASGGFGLPSGYPGVPQAAYPAGIAPAAYPQQAYPSGLFYTGLPQPQVYMPAMPFAYPGQLMQLQPRPAAAAAPAGRRHYGAEQLAVGVRTNEFHAVHHLAVYVPPTVALQLQLLWDNGNKLVSMLDEGSWRALTELDQTAGLQVINELADAMAQQNIRNVNAYLIAMAKKHFAMARGGGVDSSYGGGGGGSQAGGFGSSFSGADAFGGGSGGAGGSGQKGVPALHKLHGTLLTRAQDLLEQHRGVLREQHFDEVVANHLLRLPEADALEVLNEIGRNELISVKNVSAYIMGIINRIRRQGGGGIGAGAGGRPVF